MDGTPHLIPFFESPPCSTYSEVPNRRADWNKRAGLEESSTLLAYLTSKLINEQGWNFLFIMYMKNCKQGAGGKKI